MESTAERRATDRWIKMIRSEIEKADVDKIYNCFSLNLNYERLIRFREQKLIFSAPLNHRKVIADRIIDAVRAAFSEEESLKFNRYLDFVIYLDEVRNAKIERFGKSLHAIPLCSMANLLHISDRAFKIEIAQLLKRSNYPNSFEKPPVETELQLHDINGALNDLAHAIARTVNEAAKVRLIKVDRPMSRELQDRAVTKIRRSIYLASEINTLEWILDCIAYGEFIIENIYKENKPIFQLNYGDTRRSLVRSLSIRRKIITNIIKHTTPRYVRDMLFEAQSDVINCALSHYQQQLYGNNDDIDIEDLMKKSKMSLDQVTAEDDLLLASSRFDPKVIAHYQGSMYLRLYDLVGKAINKASRHVVGKRLPPPPIPLAQIIDEFEGGANGNYLPEALNALVNELPVRHHTHLISRPFVKDGLDTARSFLGGDFSLWTTVIRELMIQGGERGKAVGAGWEDFIASSFEGSDWKIVRRGVKLRQNNEIITDIDLLLLRDDLILVVQIKSLIGNGHTQYNHWKNRQIIEQGCYQARIASNHLKDNPSVLADQCGKKNAALVKIVQPVVITNLSHFEGWSFMGVPVIGSSSQSAICHGGGFSIVDGNGVRRGDVGSTNIKKGELNTGVILNLIHDPLEMRIAPDRHGVKHVIQHMEEFALLIPDISVIDVITTYPNGNASVVLESNR